MKRLLTALMVITILVAMSFSVLAAEQPFKGTTLRIVLSNHPWTDAIRPLLSEFEEATGIRLQVESLFEDQLSQKLLVEFASGTSTIDVFMQRPLQEAKQFQENGWYTDLRPFAEADQDIDLDDFFPSALLAETVEGVLTGIPIVTEQEIIYYRKDLFEQAGISVPTTMEEFEAAAAHFHDPENSFFGFVSRGQRAAAVTQFSSFLYSFGGNFDVDGVATLNTPESIEAFTYYGDMLRNYGPPGVLNMSWPQALAIFAQGNAAMYTDASVFYSNMLDPEQSDVGELVGFAQFPAGRAGSRPYSVVSWGISMAQTSKNKEAAWEFIKWATGKEITLAAQAGQVPSARTSAWENPEGVKSFPAQLVEVIMASSEGSMPYDRPNVIGVGEARDVVGTVIVTAIEGGDVAAAANKANRDYQAILDREK
ncbi:MAG: sugar ABC transporter substrate-binding protein [Firmicutes bacterium]|nr:sugar ABC transporter substrate-binding protein [Bacillota bacterium]